MSSTPELILRVWPSRWGLPSFMPECIASVLYLQYTLPGKFILEESTNPDFAPNGNFPYIVHGETIVESFMNIVKYVDGLTRAATTQDHEEDGTVEEGNGNARGEQQYGMTPSEKAQQAAWISFAFAHLGDLVACSLFTLRHNYYDFTRPALTELFPLPIRYYVPDRLRDSFRPRLEAAGLWSVHAEEAEEEKREKRLEMQLPAQRAQTILGLAQDNLVKEAFGKEKVLEKARDSLSILQSLLGSKPFFLTSRNPTSLDFVVASHILLLTTPLFPNDLISNLIRTSFPTLQDHASRLYSRLVPNPRENEDSTPSMSVSSSYDTLDTALQLPTIVPPLIVRPEPSQSFSQVASSALFPFSKGSFFTSTSTSSKPKVEKSEKEKEFDRKRWGFYGLAVLGVIGWVWLAGIRIVIVRQGETELEEDEDEAGGLDVNEEEGDEDEDEEEDE